MRLPYMMIIVGGLITIRNIIIHKHGIVNYCRTCRRHDLWKNHYIETKLWPRTTTYVYSSRLRVNIPAMFLPTGDFFVLDCVLITNYRYSTFTCISPVLLPYFELFWGFLVIKSVWLLLIIILVSRLSLWLDNWIYITIVKSSKFTWRSLKSWALIKKDAKDNDIVTQFFLNSSERMSATLKKICNFQIYLFHILV